MSGKNSSNYCKDLSVASRKALAYYIYHKKQGLNPSWSIYQPDVCTSEKLYAKTHLFFKWFKFISEEFHKKVYIMENTPSKVASKAYVYRKLNEIQFVRNLNRRQLKSLQEQTLQSINSDKAFDPGKKLAKLTSQDVSIIQAFIKTVKELKIELFYLVNLQIPEVVVSFHLPPSMPSRTKLYKSTHKLFGN
jgi:hypothetical protein